MGTDDTAPDGTELGSPNLSLRLVDEAHTLAHVERGGLLVLDILDLEERSVLVLVAKTPLETHHHALYIQPGHIRDHREMCQEYVSTGKTTVCMRIGQRNNRKYLEFES